MSKGQPGHDRKRNVGMGCMNKRGISEKFSRQLERRNGEMGCSEEEKTNKGQTGQGRRRNGGVTLTEGEKRKRRNQQAALH